MGSIFFDLIERAKPQFDGFAVAGDLHRCLRQRTSDQFEVPRMQTGRKIPAKTQSQTNGPSPLLEWFRPHGFFAIPQAAGA